MKQKLDNKKTSINPLQISRNKYQNGIYYLGIKAYNNLPPNIKDISNYLKKFKVKLKQILQIHSFYSLQECFNHTFS
jgi:hypothetical protein